MAKRRQRIRRAGMQMNVLASKVCTLWCADAVPEAAGNSSEEVNWKPETEHPPELKALARLKRCTTEPGRSTYLLSRKTRKVMSNKPKQQEKHDGYVEVGVSHSSKETSNDRGAKG